jgi:hypothetical protein
MEKSSRLYGAGWILSILRRLLRKGVGEARFLSRSGCAGRERFSAGLRSGERGQTGVFLLSETNYGLTRMALR